MRRLSFSTETTSLYFTNWDKAAFRVYLDWAKLCFSYCTVITWAKTSPLGLWYPDHTHPILEFNTGILTPKLDGVVFYATQPGLGVILRDR